MNKKRWIAVCTAVAIVLAAAITTAAVTSAGGHDKANDSPVLVPLTTAALPATTHPTTTTVKLPRPENPPADPYAPTPIVQLGTIEIPKIALVHPVYEGITLTVIDHGPGHWPGSALPCGVGNTVFPGHRVTHTHPFLNLDQLAPGDKIIFHMPGKVCVYAVTGTQIVQPTDIQVVDSTSAAPVVTLIACHPKHSAAQRIVVTGKLVSEVKT